MKWIAVIVVVTVVLVLAQNESFRSRFFPPAAESTPAPAAEAKAPEKKPATNAGGSRLAETEAASDMSLGASRR